MTAGFSGYSTLDWQLWLSALNTSFQALLDFRVFFFFETSGVILVGLPLYMTWCVSLLQFSAYFVLYFSVFTIVL